LNFVDTLSIRKLESLGYRVVVSLILDLAVLTQYWRVTDGQTDGHTMTAYATLA